MGMDSLKEKNNNPNINKFKMKYGSKDGFKPLQELKYNTTTQFCFFSTR